MSRGTDGGSVGYLPLAWWTLCDPRPVRAPTRGEGPGLPERFEPAARQRRARAGHTRGDEPGRRAGDRSGRQGPWAEALRRWSTPATRPGYGGQPWRRRARAPRVGAEGHVVTEP